jgi:hypothetical protein
LFPVRLHRPGSIRGHFFSSHSRRRPPRPNQPVPDKQRLRAGPHVQRRLGAGEPPLGRRLQDSAARVARHLRQAPQEAAGRRQKNGHRHGAGH